MLVENQAKCENKLPRGNHKLIRKFSESEIFAARQELTPPRNNGAEIGAEVTEASFEARFM
jgi:hypothetical protein